MKKMIVGLFLALACMAATANQVVIVSAQKLNVRADPSIKAPIVGQVSKGDRLVVIPVSDGWARVAPETGLEGFLSRKYLKSSDQRNTVSQYQKEDDYLPVSLLLVLVVTVLLASAFVRGSRKKEQLDRSAKPTIQSAAVSSVSSIESKRNVPNAQRDHRDASQTKSLDIGESTKAIQNFPMVKVEHVIDGDTVVVANTWKKTKIRLDSIDCPENGQPWGDTATAGLIKMIGGRRVRIEEHGEDYHCRLLATIYVENIHESEWINVNEKMVAKGHAWVMRRYYGHLPKQRKDKLNRLERWARTRKVGLWNTQNPIPPWKWRSGQ